MFCLNKRNNKNLSYKIALIVAGMEAMATQFKDRSERSECPEDQAALNNLANLMDYWINEINTEVLGIKSPKENDEND